MHSLFISPLGPLMPDDAWHGIHHRMRTLVRAVSQVSERVTMLHLAAPEDGALHVVPSALAAQQSALWGVEVDVQLIRTEPVMRGFRAHYVDGLLRPLHQPDFRRFTGPAQVQAVASVLATKPDLVVVQRLPAMAALLAGSLRPPRLAFDVDDLEHKARWRAALVPPFRPSSLLYAAHALRLIPAVAAAVHRAAATFVCSETDRKHLHRLGLGRRVHVVPNAVPFPPVAALPTGTPPESLLFLGNLSHAPNRQAASRLVTRIWPVVRARRPAATLAVAGQGAEGVEGFAAPPPGVSFPGFVPSLDALYAGCRVVVCPITTGGGTRLKLIEAAAYAKPIVSTRLGAEGLDFRDGQEALLRDDDASLAIACADLLADPVRCAQMGAAARARAVTMYDAAKIEQQVARLLQSL